VCNLLVFKFNCLYQYFYNKAFQEIQKRRKSLEIEKAKFFSDIIQGSKYSFSSGDRTHKILQKETQKCLNSVLKPEKPTNTSYNIKELQEGALEENIGKV